MTSPTAPNPAREPLEHPEEMKLAKELRLWSEEQWIEDANPVLTADLVKAADLITRLAADRQKLGEALEAAYVEKISAENDAAQYESDKAALQREVEGLRAERDELQARRDDACANVRDLRQMLSAASARAATPELIRLGEAAEYWNRENDLRQNTISADAKLFRAVRDYAKYVERSQEEDGRRGTTNTSLITEGEGRDHG